MEFNLPYDYANNLGDININLRTRSLEDINIITNISKFSTNINFISYDEVSFDVCKELNNVKCECWEDIKDLKVIYIQEMDKNFTIKVSLDDGVDTVKHITATALCEDELSHIILYGIEINTESDILRDDYTIPTKFYNPSNVKNSLLNRLLEKAKHYSINHVDDSLKNIQRQFSFDNISILDALNQIQEDIGCLFKYNSNTREINVYDLKNYCYECGKRFDSGDECSFCGSSNIKYGYGNETDIFVSKENLATLISIDGDESNYKNCLRIKTGDELLDATIKSLNPNGSEYIYYFNEDIENDMPTNLVNRIREYNDNLNFYNTLYSYTFNGDYVKEYNNMIDVYNGDDYRYYEYDLDGNKVLKNRNFIEIGTTIGYQDLIELEYDILDFSTFLSYSMMPYIIDEETTIDDDISNINYSNISPIGVTNIRVLSASTVESYIKKLVPIYTKKSYNVTVSTTSYLGYDDTTEVALWSGDITLTEYRNESVSRTVHLSNVRVTGDVDTYINQKLLKELKDKDDNGSLYNIMKLNGDNFKNALKLYSESRLESFYNAFDSCLGILQEMGFAEKDKVEYTSLYLPMYEKRRMIYYEDYDKQNETIVYGGELFTRRNQIVVVEQIYNELQEQLSYIQNELNFENFIGKDMWDIFCMYRREDVYANSNVTSDGLSNAELIKLAQEIISNAKEDIKLIGNIQKTITSDLLNFLALPEFKGIKNQFNVGNWIHTEIDDTIYRLRLLNISISISDDGSVTISPTFSTVENNGDELGDIKSILNNAQSLSSSIGEIKRVVAKNEEIDQFMKDLDNGLNLTNKKIVNNAKNQNVVQDSNGILVRSYNDVSGGYEDEQLKIMNSTIAITDDNWESAKTAIGKFIYIDPNTGNEVVSYGVIGDTIVGNLFIGHQLQIYDNNNNGVIVTDEQGNVTIGNNSGKVKIQGDVNLETNTTLRRYFDFANEEGLVIGLAVDDTSYERPYKLVLNERKISFRENDNEIAFISGKDFNITSGYLFQSLRIGDFAFIPRTNGSLDFKKVTN